MRDSGARGDSDARGGATMRATRAMPTAPDASAMAAARAETGIVEGINPIGTATASGVAARRHPGSAVANAPPSAPVIATVPSARPSIKTATATSPRRLVRTPPGESRTQRLLRKGVPSARKAAVAAAAGADVDGAGAVVVHVKASRHRARK